MPKIDPGDIIAVFSTGAYVYSITGKEDSKEMANVGGNEFIPNEHLFLK